jgi:HK97 family phage portal protein
MRLFGYDISLRKAASLSPVNDSRGWVTIHDFIPGGFQRDISIDVARAQSHWAVFACQTLIAGDVGKLGVKLTQWDSRTKIYEEVDSPSVTPFLNVPNHFQTWQKFIEQWILSKVSNGNTYVLKQRDARNVVIKGYVLDPCKVTPMVSNSGDVFYKLGDDKLSGVTENSIVVPASDIIHDRYWCLFHPLVGISPIYASGLAATQGLDIQNHASRFFRNSAVPSGLLVTPQRIDDELAKKYQARWETNYGGENRGRTAVLGNGLEYKPITQTAVESELVEQLKLSAEMVCSVYHVPPYKIGIGPMPTYQNAEVLNQIYYSDCLQVLVQAVETCLTQGLDLPKKGYKVQLDEDDLLRMDKLTQMEFVAKGIEKAVFSPNDARRRFNEPPVEGGNSPMIQQQNFSLEALAKRDAKADPFGTEKPTQPEPAQPAEDKHVALAALLRRADATRTLRLTNG